jgi:hypothetical protein
MNPRKRAASDTLFQTRATKHLRRTRERYIGRGNATPSQQEGLAAQWMRLWGQTRKLFGETIAQLSEGNTAQLVSFCCRNLTQPL